MTKLTPEQIARHAYDAGFRGDGLTTAVAVALAESGGNTRAHNATPPDNSYGLWQINMLGAMGPERRRQFGLDSNAELFDAATNAKAANKISGDGKSWTPWSTYTNGAYERHLPAARKAAEAVRKHPGKNPSGGGLGQIRVDGQILNGFVRRTRRVGDALTSASANQVKDVRSIADDSFGKIGKESGFADALGDFGAALQSQVKAVGTSADRLADAAAKAGKAYHDRDASAAARLNQLA
ncbi:transglycosylase SLT domain-containing protein [Amycolatopsis pittospori]|uniref:transglycosylase SLT domain-containing protein n=1 Tax=Amycolatopsis pittospori TaxID=2749434 RepID=UPI0015F05618|nr:transglycosylase SLT domain-containing protein [Amycolatopsis pittospori]